MRIKVLGLIVLTSILFVGCGGYDEESEAFIKYQSSSKKSIKNNKFFDTKITVTKVIEKDTPFGKMFTFTYDSLVTAKAPTCISKEGFNRIRTRVVKGNYECNGKFIMTGDSKTDEKGITKDVNEMYITKYLG